MKETTKTFTYQTRFSLDNEKALNAYGTLFNQLERKLYANLAAKIGINELKRHYIATYGITARQFNSLQYSIKGKIASAKECQKLQIEKIKDKISRLENKLKKSKKLTAEVIFLKKGSLNRLKKKLKNLEDAVELGKVSLCFGSNQLFREQFHLENKTQEDWKKAWSFTRNNQFFSVGSKDETGGNQSCLLTQKENRFCLRLRLPNGLEKAFGKYLVIENIEFHYGKEKVLEAITSEKRKAMTYRFLKDEKGWRLFVSFEEQAKAFITKKECGMIGIDINVDHLALVEIDRDGNKLQSKRIQLNLYGKSKEQAKAIIGDAVKEVVELAKQKKVPITLENLNFEKKKRALKDKSATEARMLSSFSYAKILENFESKAFKEGVEILKVSPAYTSMLGVLKYKKNYGLSTHATAAYCIARRGMGYLEKLPFGQTILIMTNEGSYLQFSLPVRNKKLDEYEMLKEVFKNYKAVHVAHIRANKIRSLLSKR
jgi:IS605 OrfB family transposase